MVTITKTSPITGRTVSMQLAITEAQYRNWKESAVLIQDAFPQLTADEREFLMTGIAPDEWGELFEQQD